ncbi:MAG: DNA alkylation repair protein [Deltaproteobacteria bacterium]|nr:DNA alkylation repair protein [Deltaproteobacteria bacterium]
MAHAMVARFEAEARALANEERAAGQAAYMKRALPFLGVTRPQLAALRRGWRREYPLAAPGAYEAVVEGLWALPFQEGRYQAVWVCRTWPLDPARLPLYRRMIEEGAWWDLVDELAAHVVGRLLLEHREALSPVIRAWGEAPHLWVRRTAILAQLQHKEHTDEALLFDLCAARAHEPDFFIRKAIGWALRQHARVAPEAVRAFLEAQGPRLSGLSRREAAKHL